MSTHRKARLTRRLAEELLDHAPSAGGDSLSRLLTAASATSAASRQPGERAALEGYRAAAAAATSTTTGQAGSRGHSLVRARLGKILAAKLLTTAVAFGVSAGGIAVAAETGHLPTVLQRIAHATINAPAGNRHGKPQPQPPPFGGRPSGPATTARSQTSSAKPSQHRRPAGPQASHPTGPQASHPTGPQASHPTGPQASHPTGPQATHPTGPQATHPTGPQATHPTGPQATHRTAPQATHPTGPPASHPTVRVSGHATRPTHP